jgi:hypothetical protein
VARVGARSGLEGDFYDAAWTEMERQAGGGGFRVTARTGRRKRKR